MDINNYMRFFYNLFSQTSHNGVQTGWTSAIDLNLYPSASSLGFISYQQTDIKYKKCCNYKVCCCGRGTGPVFSKKKKKKKICCNYKNNEEEESLTIMKTKNPFSFCCFFGGMLEQKKCTSLLLRSKKNNKTNEWVFNENKKYSISMLLF